jgi:peptidoglycan/LPS O-acetylase OafA/YrhL
MRGLAILLVVFYHNFGFINYFFFGWLGVDLFFVLSGYLITNILITTRQTKKFLANFYIRRVLRIFPLYYLSLILFLIVIPRIPDLGINLSYYVSNQLWFWVYCQNWLFIFNPTNDTNILHHFWSLAVEEQFYLFWPPFLLLIGNPKRLLIILASLLICLVAFRSLIWIYKIEQLAYFNFYTFTRIDGICIGCMVALLQKINSKFLNSYQPVIISIFACFNFLFYFINLNSDLNFPYLALVGYTTFSMLFGLLVYEGVQGGNNFIQTIFCWKPLVYLGKISFGLYIFHWPVYVLLKSFFDNWISANFNINPNLATSLILSLMAVLISILSFTFFEVRFLKLKKHFV